MRNKYRRAATIIVAGAMLLQNGGTANATNYAGLVVRHGDGSIVTRCVAFEESSISGIDLLYASGLSVEGNNSGYGVSVYGIDGEGTADDWNSGRASWSYWHLRGGWVFSPIGSSSYAVKPGDVEGWSWGSQTGPVMPPAVSFDQIYREAYGDPPAPVSSPAETAPAAGSAAPPGSPANGATAGSSGPVTGAAVTNGPASSAGSNISGSDKPREAGTTTAKAGTGTATKEKDSQGRTSDYMFFGFILVGLCCASGYYYLRKKP